MALKNDTTGAASSTFITYRLDKLEETVAKDHEPRLRDLESMASKLALSATLGALLGGGVVVSVVEFLLRR